MAILQVQKFNALQEDRKQNYIAEVKKDNPTISDSELKRLCDSYFPQFNRKTGYVIYDPSFRSPELRIVKRKN